MNLKLIPSHPDLAETFYQYRQDPVTQMYNPLVASDVLALRERLAHSSSDLSEFATADSFFWFVKVDSEIVGNVTLQNINRIMLTAEIGYGTMPAARGRGIATAAVVELTKRLFDQTPLRKIVALVHAQNLGKDPYVLRRSCFVEVLLKQSQFSNDLRPAMSSI